MSGVVDHLDARGRVNLGSFYTPGKYVRLIGGWLLAHGVDSSWTIADISCGYGAFYQLHGLLPGARFIANDIDREAVARAKEKFPFVECHCRNSLSGISRENYGISRGERLAIVGNPPYNDTTSIVGRGIKRGASCAIDEAVKSRDLGISSLLAYSILEPEFVAVLHPLSYLIKEANFKAGRGFFEKYRLLEHVVFSSQEFAGTSRCAGFPVIAALYKRDGIDRLDYQKILQTTFHTAEGDSFRLAGRDYVGTKIAKYPHAGRYKPEILFYTLRDINALRRSRTFLKERCANAIDVAPCSLPYYCYVDCFKRYARTPYWMGNFDIPYIEAEFKDIEEDVVADAKSHHPEIFGDSPRPSADARARIQEYIRRSLQG